MNDDRRQEDFGPESIRCLDTRFEICQDVDLVLKIGRDFQNKDGFHGAHFDTVKLLCDTIEYQQEQLETKTEVGDAVKLREALSKFCAYSAVVLNTGMFNRVHLEALLNIAKAALAAPPRNCYLFDTKDKAREAFQKLRGHCVWADVSLWDNRDEIEAFVDWLFATKKGESNEQK